MNLQVLGKSMLIALITTFALIGVAITIVAFIKQQGNAFIVSCSIVAFAIFTALNYNRYDQQE